MTYPFTDKNRQLQPPGNYCIQVEGRLAADWSDRLGGLRISTVSEGDRLITSLCGPLIDQASLLGVINTLYDLQLTILSVERMDDEGRPVKSVGAR